MKTSRHNVGVVGAGYVGGAIIECMTNVANIRAYDKYKASLSLIEVVVQSDIIFVAVPTPMKDDGGCDTSIVEIACKEIADVTTKKKIIVIKSTVTPGTADRISSLLENKHAVFFNPEFLTEANFIEDFMTQDRIILGKTASCKRHDIAKLRKLYRDFLLKCRLESPIRVVEAKEAEMLKYAANAFLATKVTFFNELYQICELADVDFDEVVQLMVLDKRIGNSHNKVPGPDGDMGFGGKCFPKDLNGLIKYAESIERPEAAFLEPEDCFFFLKSVWDKNVAIRKNRDWEKIKGATSSNLHGDE